MNADEPHPENRRRTLGACPLGQLRRGRALLLHAASRTTPLLLSNKAPRQRTIGLLSAGNSGIDNGLSAKALLL